MNKIILTFLLLFMTFYLSSCNKTEKEKFDVILNSDNLEIQVIGYGGIAGRFEQKLFLKKNEFESILISNKGTDYQNFVEINNDRRLLKEFITEAFNTHEPNKELVASCMLGFDYEYIFINGFTRLELKPNRSCDSLFNLLMKNGQ